jgi:serine/threonine protein kinase
MGCCPGKIQPTQEFASDYKYIGPDAPQHAWDSLTQFGVARQVLVHLRDSTGYEHWRGKRKARALERRKHVKAGWNKLESCTTIEELGECCGVDILNGSVHRINLREINLRGVLPTSLSKLDSLVVLSLSGNKLEGSIPTHIGSVSCLPRLERLYVQSNHKLSGIIDASFLDRSEECQIHDTYIQLPRARAPQTHSFVICDSHFEVDIKYTHIEWIGTHMLGDHGASAVIVAAHNMVSREKVEIKKISHCFNELVDTKHILREVKLGRHFKHENIVKNLDLMQPSSAWKDVYVVSEFMETDLHQIIYSDRLLDDEQVKYYLYQILCALKCMHSANVLHCDIKPSNLAVNNTNGLLKVCNFSEAQSYNREPWQVEEKAEQLGQVIGDGEGGGVQQGYRKLSEYGFRRAPEAMLPCHNFTAAIDVWSTGCILAELLGRTPLFGGDDSIHTLQLILETLGTQQDEDLEFIACEKAQGVLKAQVHVPKVSFASTYPEAHPQAVDLLDRMLVFNPGKRITVEEALAHPYFDAMALFTELRPLRYEPVAAAVFSFDFEQRNMTRERLQELLFDECVHSTASPEAIAIATRQPARTRTQTGAREARPKKSAR